MSQGKIKILGGSAKGTILYSPKGTDTRPALARLRNSLFNILGESIIDKDVLDLFAGTGSLGLEALSRGARSGLFVESDKRCFQAIRKNIEKLRFQREASVIFLNAFQIVPFAQEKDVKFDIVFVAPPYRFFDDEKLYTRLFNLLDEMTEKGILLTEGLIIIEHRPGQVSAESFESLVLKKSRSYGQTVLSFFVRRA